MGSYKWVICRVAIVITYIRGLITPLTTANELPSSSLKHGPFLRSPITLIRRRQVFRVWGVGFGVESTGRFGFRV